MKLERIFVAFMALFIGVALVYLFTKSDDAGIELTPAAQAGESVMRNSEATFGPKSTGSLGPGDALVELTPVSVDRGKVVLKFTINTHSVRLSGYDLRQITTLEYKGKELKPVKASRIGGHHSSGTIEFQTGEEIGTFTIKIKGIPRVEERVFEWNVMT